jgi:uncharacterized metal-binding protein
VSSGIVHKNATKKLVIPYSVTSFLVLYYNLPLYKAFSLSIMGGFGVMTGILMTPDLDHIEATLRHFKSKTTLQKVWFLRWYPYGKLLDHRSFFSHFPVVGTLLRLVYILPELLIVIALLSRFINIYDLMMFIISWAGGLLMSDILHYIMDIVSSSIKRLTKS